MSVKTEQTPGNSEKMVRIRIVKELPDKTPAASKSGSHSCDHCQLIFPTATQLKIHLLECHMNEATNSCKDCFRTFQRVEALHRHVLERICVSKRVVPCPYCAAPFPNRSKLATHVSTVHLRAPRSVLCDACGAVFSRRGALHRHLDTMHGGRAGGPGGGPVAPRRCPLCPAAFRAVDNLQRHLVSRHANWKRWMCSLCRQRYNHSVDLKRHVLKKHGLVLPSITGRRKKNILDMHVLPGPAEAAPLPPALAERQRQLRRLLAMVPAGRYDPELLAVFGRLPLARPGVKQAQPGTELTAELTAEPEPVPADGDLTEPRVEVQFVERCPPDTPEHVTESREELERSTAPPEQAAPAGPEVPVGQPVPVGVVGTVEVVERPLLLSAPVLVMGGGAAGLPLLLLPPPPPPPPPPPTVQLALPPSVSAPVQRYRRRTIGRRATAEEVRMARGEQAPPAPPWVLLPAQPSAPCEPVTSFSLVKAPETGAVTLVAVPGGAAPAEPGSADGRTLSVLTGAGEGGAPLVLTELPPPADATPQQPPPACREAEPAFPDPAAVSRAEVSRHPPAREAILTSQQHGDPAAGRGAATEPERVPEGEPDRAPERELEVHGVSEETAAQQEQIVTEADAQQERIVTGPAAQQKQRKTETVTHQKHIIIEPVARPRRMVNVTAVQHTQGMTKTASRQLQPRVPEAATHPEQVLIETAAYPASTVTETAVHPEQVLNETVAHSEQMVTETVAHPEQVLIETVAHSVQVAAETVAHPERMVLVEPMLRAEDDGTGKVCLEDGHQRTANEEGEVAVKQESRVMTVKQRESVAMVRKEDRVIRRVDWEDRTMRTGDREDRTMRTVDGEDRARTVDQKDLTRIMDREDRTMETVPQEDGGVQLDESAVRTIDRSGRAAYETSAPREAAEEDGQSLIVDEGMVVPAESAFVADTSHRFAIAFRENEMIRARKYPQPSHSSSSLAADAGPPEWEADGAGAPHAAKLTKPRVVRTRSGRAVRSKVRLSTSVSEPDERPEQPARTPTKRFSRPRAERAPSPCEDDPPAAAEDRRRSDSGAARPAPAGEGARVPPLESAAAPAAPPAAPPVPRRSWTPWAGGRGKGLLPRVVVRMDEHGAPRTLALLATSLSVRTEADRRQSRYPCIVCERPQRSKTSLRAHLVSHTGERPFQCSACPAAFRHFANARGHLRRHTAARCACDVCGRTFLLRADLRRHQRTHSQRPKLACHLCPSTFSRADNLARHVRVAHGAEPPPTHRCDRCQKEFKTEAWLKQHMTIHKAAREHVCAQCGRKFALRSYLERHLKSHGQTRVYCDLCPRRFINIKNLTVHRQTFHRNPVPLTAEEQRRAAEPRPEPARRSPAPPPAGVRPRRISLEIVRSRRPPRRLLQETEREDGESEESGGSDEEWTPDRR